MVASLQLRKDALEAKIIEKTAELKRLCLQEADLTGVLPPETPLEPGEPPPPVRRRIGTSFSFPQSLINNLNGSDDASLGALELECKVQTNIAEAALALANNPAASKSVRKKHRLMYRQSQRQLMELETRLSLLKQGKHQLIKPQQIKKKPRPNTTTVDHIQLMREFKSQNANTYLGHGAGSWPIKNGIDFGSDDLRQFNSLQRHPRSSTTSLSSSSPRLAPRDLSACNSSGLPDQYTLASSLSQPNIQDNNDLVKDPRRSERRSSGRRQWDSQSAAGTLLPNQTYPDIHQPNLNRTQSLGSVDGQRQAKEKEWYETSLDSAPSPPLRTSSRLPTSARMFYHMQELQIRDAVNRSLAPQHVHPVLSRTHRATPVDEMVTVLQGMRITSPSKNDTQEQPSRPFNYRADSTSSSTQQTCDSLRPVSTRQHFELPVQSNYHQMAQSVSYNENQISELANNIDNHFAAKPVDARWIGDCSRLLTPHLDTTNVADSPHISLMPRENHNPKEELQKLSTQTSDAVYIDIPEDDVDGAQVWKAGDRAKTPTQPYYHKGTAWVPSVSGLPEFHPPHAITQEEIAYDTVVPFESPQNHTVVQAGIWQPYREVTKPFEMSDFYKYSTKFRQARLSPGQQHTPEPSRKCSGPVPLQQRVLDPSPGSTLMGVYQPLRPMTCQPLERRAGSSTSTPVYVDPPPPPSVSAPKIV